MRRDGRLLAVLAGALFAAGCGAAPGAPVADGGAAAHDSGAGAHDGGTVAHDGGTVAHDGGTVAYDGGAVAHDGGGVTDDGGAAEDGGPGSDAGPVDNVNPTSACTVSTMDATYAGYLPTNPYAPAAPMTSCVRAPHDAIMVLGCPNDDGGAPSACQKKRADIAVALAAAGLGARFIVSGGAIHNEYVEAETLRHLLLDRGIPSASVLLEPRAAHTDENIYYSTKIMETAGWETALVVSDDPGHLIMTAVCDSNCCVQLGRLTIFELTLTVAGASGSYKVGHYVRYPGAVPVSAAECTQIESPLKLMCLNLSSRLACADDFQLPP